MGAPRPADSLRMRAPADKLRSVIPFRDRVAVAFARAVGAALVAACLAGCDTRQIAMPVPSGVQWLRITNTTDLPDPYFPDWRGNRIALSFRVNVAYRRVGVIDPSGNILYRYAAGSTERNGPAQWVDDSTVVFASDRSGNFDVWSWVVTTDQLQQLTTAPENEYDPAPRPGAPDLALTDGSEFSGRVLLIPDYQTTDPQRIFLTPSTMKAGQIAWDPTGQKLCFTADSSGYRHVWMISFAAGDSTPVQLTSGPYVDSGPRFSPDGARILFATDKRTGRPGVWTVAPGVPNVLSLVVFEDPNAVVDTPCWSPDGSRIVVSSNSHNYPRALWILSDLP